MSKDKNSIRVKNESELLKLIPANLRNEYAIGIHGFDDEYWKRDSKGVPQLDKKRIEESKKNILENGLTFKSGRSLLSTVRFSDIDSYIGTDGYYSAGGIIVALPKVLRKEDGTEIFIGSPNENISSYSQWDRNHEPTSLCDAALPQDNNLNSMFILGTYDKNENGIQINLNENHISFNRGIVSDKFYDEVKDRINKMKKQENQVPFEETAKQQKDYEKEMVFKKPILTMKSIVMNALGKGLTKKDVKLETSSKDKEEGIQKDE